jgi:uncharacterized membrane protein YdbT with pleckstrin-like domain
MKYLRNYVGANEPLLLTTELHWILFLYPFLYSIMLVLFVNFRSIHFPPIIHIGGGVIVAVAWILAMARYLFTEFALSKQRVLMKQGLIRVQTAELLMARIESVEMQQSILGRILGYGTLLIHGTGGNQLVFRQIADPVGFRQKVLVQAEAASV